MAYTAKDAAGNTIYLDGAGTGADSGNAITPNSTIIGAINETAPGTDTASSGLNGRLQRIAVRLTSLIALFPSSIGQKAKTGSLSVTLASDQDALPITDNAGSITVDGTVSVTGVATAAKQPALGTAGTASADVITVQGIASMTALKVDGSAVTQPVSAASLPLPSGAATSANQTTANTSLASLETKIGEVQASPTSNTVLDRLKAIATALAGTLTVATHAVTQSGTWTVQPGNTANTTAWKVDGSAVAQPVTDNSGSLTVDTADTVIDVTPTMDISAYAAGDVFFDTTAISGVGTVNGGTVTLNTITVLDEDDQGPTFQMVFLDTNNTLGTINNPPTISDANSRKILGTLSSALGTWVDLGGCRVMTITNIGLVMKCDAASSSLYFGSITSTATTQTASGLKFKLGFLR